MSKEQFVGTWKLMDAQAQLANGKVLLPIRFAFTNFQVTD